VKKTRWHSCNVLSVGADARQLWQFEARGGGFKLDRTRTVPAGQSLPAQWVFKDWRTLWQPKLNIAWLPPEQVFLRVAQFPATNPEETRAMVELQLEKLSPVPVTQIVWTLHVLPEVRDNQQTVVVVIVARDVVEAFLGQLEGQGFLADRLELSLLDELETTPAREDGTYVHARADGPSGTALVAWWTDGVLRNLSLLHLPASDDRAGQVRQQLTQAAWAGELDGWLTTPPAWHLVADETIARNWEPVLREALEVPVQIVAPPSPAELAARTANRAGRASDPAGLLPLEFAKRYQQQFVDRLWIRGLLAIGAVYCLGVLVYFAALGVVVFQKNSVEQKVAALSQSYTNALQFKARYQVLKDRQELKYAALDCWRLVAELLPEGAVVQGLDFADGRKLTLNGNAPADQVMAVIEFSSTLRKASVRGQPMFDSLKGEAFTQRQNPGAATVTWSFGLELNRTEEK
jgi:hypothetical protein